MIKLLIVDDHELVRTGIRRIIEEAMDMEVVGEASGGDDALKAARKIEPHVVLMDVNMPGMGGIEATRRMVRLFPDVKVIAWTVLDDDPFPARLMEAGALGYLTKSCPTSHILDAIRMVHRGQTYVAPSVASKHMVADWRGVVASTPFEELSQREMLVAMMILGGQRTQEISDELSLSPKTVNTYCQRIYVKLNVKNDVSLTRLAYRHGLIKDGDMDYEAFKNNQLKKSQKKTVDVKQRPMKKLKQSDSADAGLYPYIIGGLLHDARNTLSAVSYRFQELARDADPKRIVKFMELNAKSLQIGIDHTERVLDLLHSVSRSFYEEPDFRKHSFLSSVLEVIENFRLLHPAIDYRQDIQADFECPKIPPGVVSFIVQEFLENATKNTRLNSHAEIFLRLHGGEDDNSVIIECQDNGVGLPEKVHESLQNGRIRLPDKSSRGGFGLYLINEITLRLKGRVSGERLTPHGSRLTAHLRWDIKEKR